MNHVWHLQGGAPWGGRFAVRGYPLQAGALKFIQMYERVEWKAMDSKYREIGRGIATTPEAAALAAAFKAAEFYHPDLFEMPAKLNPYTLLIVALYTPNVEVLQRARDQRIEVAKLRQEVRRLKEYIAGQPSNWIRNRNVAARQRAEPEGWDSPHSPSSRNGRIADCSPSDDGDISDSQGSLRSPDVMLIFPGGEGYQNSDEREGAEEIFRAMQQASDERIGEALVAKAQEIQQRKAAKTQAGYLTSGGIRKSNGKRSSE